MPRAEKMRVAMVGVGGFGGARRDIMRRSGCYEIAAAFDFNEAALKACVEQDGAVPAGSYEALLETPDIEAMFISTGASSHADYSLAAMARGLHVFVEKPLCSTAAEMQALLDKQKATGLVVGLGHTDHRHDPKSLKIKDMIDSGELGSVSAFEKTTCHNGGLLIAPGDWRGDPDKNPGGMLFQCGVHGLHELMFYFGPIESVFCMMRHDLNPNTGTADVAQCVLRFKSGLTGILNAYHICPYRHTLSIFGTRQNIYLDERYFDEGTHAFTQTAGQPGHKEELVPLVYAASTHHHGTEGVESFYQAVREGGIPYPSLRDGALAVAAVFAAEESAKSGQIVPLPVIG